MYMFNNLFIVIILNSLLMKYKYFVWKINFYHSEIICCSLKSIDKMT